MFSQMAVPWGPTAEEDWLGPPHDGLQEPDPWGLSEDDRYGWGGHKYGYETKFVFTHLWPLFNTVRVPLQDRQGFYADLIATARRAQTREALFEMLGEQQKARIGELVKARNELHVYPWLRRTMSEKTLFTSWGILGRGSLDCMVHFACSIVYGWETSGMLPSPRPTTAESAAPRPTRPAAVDWAADEHVWRHLTLKFGLDASRVMSDLWPRFNTVVIPIQEENPFLKDVCAITLPAPAHGADRARLFGALADRQEARLAELRAALAAAARLVLRGDALGTTVPADADWAAPLLRLAYRRSLDGLLRFLAGFQYGWEGDGEPGAVEEKEAGEAASAVGGTAEPPQQVVGGEDATTADWPEAEQARHERAKLVEGRAADAKPASPKRGEVVDGEGSKCPATGGDDDSRRNTDHCWEGRRKNLDREASSGTQEAMSNTDEADVGRYLPSPDSTSAKRKRASGDDGSDYSCPESTARSRARPKRARHSASV